MIVNHAHRFVFIKTRKTAGTSIEVALSEHCSDDDLITQISPEDEALRTRGQQNANGFKNHSPFSAAQQPGYYSFCFERNPFDKHVSDFYWHNPQDERPDINEWKPNARQRSNWVLYTIRNTIAVDFVGRFHCLEEDLQHVCDVVGLPTLKLPRAKGRFRQNHEHYSKVLNPETRARIEKDCHREISAFEWCRWSVG